MGRHTQSNRTSHPILGLRGSAESQESVGKRRRPSIFMVHTPHPIQLPHETDEGSDSLGENMMGSEQLRKTNDNKRNVMHGHSAGAHPTSAEFWHSACDQRNPQML